MVKGARKILRPKKVAHHRSTSIFLSLNTGKKNWSLRAARPSLTTFFAPTTFRLVGLSDFYKDWVVVGAVAVGDNVRADE
jgi:hypothetical protein